MDKMSKAFKIVLMVCAIVLVLAVSGSMIYYFVFFKPGIEKAEQQSEIANKIANKKALIDCLAQIEEDRTTALVAAYIAHSERWEYYSR